MKPNVAEKRYWGLARVFWHQKTRSPRGWAEHGLVQDAGGGGLILQQYPSSRRRGGGGGLFKSGPRHTMRNSNKGCL